MSIFVCLVPSMIDIPKAPLPRMLDFCKAVNNSSENISSIYLGYLPWTPDKKISLRGTYQNVNYYYTCLNKSKPKYKLIRNYFKIISFLRAITFLFKNRNAIEVVHIHFREVLWKTIWLWFSCKISGIKLSRELAEFPIKKEKSKKQKFYRKLHDIFVYKLFDGYIPITTYLENWVKVKGSKQVTIERIPISVDLTKFNPCPIPSNKSLFRLGYVGVLKYGDELEFMLKMFQAVHNRAHEAKLSILGDFTGNETEVIEKTNEFRNRQRELGITDSINMLGFVDHLDVPDILCSCDILILPRPFTIISKAGFPSKLAEYLALEKPVVITATGDIPLYLEDGKSAYLVNSDSPDEFAKKVIQAMSNPDEARQIACNGRKVAEESFSLPVIGKLLSEYVNRLNRQ